MVLTSVTEFGFTPVYPWFTGVWVIPSEERTHGQEKTGYDCLHRPIGTNAMGNGM